MVGIKNLPTLYLIIAEFLLRIRECEPMKQTGIDEFIEASSKRRSQDTLSCHICHSETHDNCTNLIEDEDGKFGYPALCDRNSTFCMVRKFSFTLTDENQTWPMKTFGIKRNCTSKCDPGCVIMGERTRLYVCNSCCKEDNCNAGSSAEVSTKYSFNKFSIHGFFLTIFTYVMYVMYFEIRI